MNKLLLIDGSITTQRVVELIFENEDVDVYLASTGSEGIEKIRLKKPDIVLASARLPDMEGRQVCRIMKTDLGRDGVPFILLTDETSGSDRSLDEEAGVDDRIEKPFDSVSLLRLTRKYLPDMDVTPAPAKGEERLPESVETMFDDIVVEETTPHPDGDIGSAAPDAKEVDAEFEEEIISPPHGAEEVPVEKEAERAPEDRGMEAPEPTQEEIEPTVGESILDEFQQTLKNLAREIWAGMEMAGTRDEGADQDEGPPTGTLQPPSDDAGRAHERGGAGSIEIEKITDEEMKKVFSPEMEGGAAQPSPAASDAPPDSAREPSRGPSEREEITLYLQKAMEKLSDEVIDAVKREVRALFPGLAEAIIREEIERLKRGDDD